MKRRIIRRLEQDNLEKLLTKLLQTDTMALFELYHAADTIDLSRSLRNEIYSLIEISFDNVGLKKIFINFPRIDHRRLRKNLRPLANAFSETSSSANQQKKVQELLAILKPLFEDESVFYVQLSETLRSIMLKERLTDSQKLLVSTQQPFCSSSGDSSSNEEAYGTNGEARDEVDSLEDISA